MTSNAAARGAGDQAARNTALVMRGGPTTGCARGPAGRAAQPPHRLRVPVLDLDPRPRAGQGPGLLAGGPPPAHVDLEGRLMLQGERLRIAPARAPDDLRDL